MKTSPFETIRKIINYWWLILLAGILLVGMGIWIIAFPVQSYLSLSLAFAVCIVMGGGLEIVFSISSYRFHKGWGWTLVSGLIDLFIGGYLFYYPEISMAVLPMIVAFWIFFRGVIAIGNAIEVHRYGFHGWGWLLASGIGIVLLSILVLIVSTLGAAIIIVWTGLAFIFAGIIRILLSLSFRKIKINVLNT
ncbi:MAG: DUF308 domain-containing protein [Flavipsychrobacter sp.]|nr:DUF308 domain-containing protein [Flavipsychrobacter sp.]